MSTIVSVVCRLHDLGILVNQSRICFSFITIFLNGNFAFECFQTRKQFRTQFLWPLTFSRSDVMFGRYISVFLFSQETNPHCLMLFARKYFLKYSTLRRCMFTINIIAIHFPRVEPGCIPVIFDKVECTVN